MAPYVRSLQQPASRAKANVERVKQLIITYYDYVQQRLHYAKMTGQTAHIVTQLPPMPWESILELYQAICEDIEELGQILASRHISTLVGEAELTASSLQAEACVGLLQPRSTDFARQWTQSKDLVELGEDLRAAVAIYVASPDHLLPASASDNSDESLVVPAGREGSHHESRDVTYESFRDIEARAADYNRVCANAAQLCDALASAEDDENVEVEDSCINGRHNVLHSLLTSAKEKEMLQNRKAHEQNVDPRLGRAPLSLSTRGNADTELLSVLRGIYRGAFPSSTITGTTGAAANSNSVIHKSGARPFT